MSCALWLHNYELKPVIIEREAALGGMARRSPYPNEWLLGRAHESARENASAFTRHMAEISVATWLGAQPRQLRRGQDGSFLLDVEVADPGVCPEHEEDRQCDPRRGGRLGGDREGWRSKDACMRARLGPASQTRILGRMWQ